MPDPEDHALRVPRASRLASLAALIALALAAPAAQAQSAELPDGFGGISVGDRWEDVEARFPYRVLDETASAWDGHALECGYRSVVIDADKGRLLLVINDSVVTEVSLITPIKEDSDLLAVADLVMRTYGQPDRASMRNALGRVTIDKAQVNHVTLEYNRPRAVEFTISGRGLWQYRIKVRHENYRWYENNMLRCARRKASEPKEEPAQTQ